MNYGGFWIRFIAYSVDYLILMIGLVGVAVLLGLMGLSLAGGPLISLVVVFLYFAVLQSSSRQATFGKALVGLKVTDVNGGRISFLRSLARTAATIVSYFTFYIGFIIAAFTGRKQALHDMIAGTLVVREKPGRVVLAVAIAVLGPVVMVGAIAMFAGAMVAGLFAGGMASGMLDAQTQAAMKAAQAPKPAAPASKPAAPAPTVAAKPTPAAPSTAMAAPAKPAVVAAAPAAATPAPSTAMVVTEAAKPAAKQQGVQVPKDEPKEEAKEEVKEDAVVMTTGPGAVDLTPKSASAPAAAPAVVLIPRSLLGGPVAAGPKFNDLTTAVIYRDAAAVNDLISFGKWPDKADSNGTTPLMLAVELGDAPIAEALLKAGANANRAMPVAREKKDAAMISLLERHGGR